MPVIQNNISLPRHLYGYVRNSYCSDVDPKLMVPCVIFGVEVVPGVAPMFHILREDGALYSQLPLHALAHSKLPGPAFTIRETVRWDAFGWNVSAVAYEYLRGMTFRVKRRFAKKEQNATYLCTLDYFDNGWSEHPEQHKHFHLLAADDGNYLLESNDHCRVNDESFVDFDRLKKPVQLKRNTEHWSSEM